MLRVSWTEKRTNESIFTDGDRTSKKSFVAETEGSKTEDDVLWPCDASKRYGKGYDAGMGQGKKEERLTKEELDGGNTHDVWQN